ncbi:MAG: DNA mismatch repair protein MutT, partial [Dehalococcoidia bacterium]|nr:DNA mismatch repair protein MutT [Dehalococcoidia bacterium]
LEYTNIAYGLLPEQFTFRDLHETYEAILRKPLDRRNFRKRMLSMGIIEATGGTRREGAHRPAKLYRFTSREPVFL